MQRKPIEQQTVVLTGATSGIGLATARRIASRGANLILVARTEAPLRELADELNENRAKALSVVADVGREEDAQRIAAAAIQRFGSFDCWINNAGSSIFGRMLKVPTADSRRLFDTNFWGVVHGSLSAARYFCEQQIPGVIINVGSVLSDRAIPIQGMYSASKHAVKGFTDALRMELEADGLPISVSLVKPSSINTPFVFYAKNYTDRKAKLPPPVYAPEVVAEAIVRCVEAPLRDVTVGGGGRLLSILGNWAPRMTDRLMEAHIIDAQRKTAPNREIGEPQQDAVNGLHEDGDYDGYVLNTSAYTRAALHPVVAACLVAGAGAVIGSAVGKWVSPR